MNLKNCRRCGKIFSYAIGDIICASCKEKDEEQFQLVKEYIKENPNSHIEDVSKETHTDKRQIIKWIREERLVITEHSVIKLDCESCGKPITSGRYCAHCKKEILHELQGTTKITYNNEYSRNRENRMRFLNKQKK